MAQLERSSSSVRESMAAIQRSSSTLKEAAPMLQRSNSMLKGSPSSAQLRAQPSSVKDALAQIQNRSFSASIRNRNIVIGVLSTFLFIAVVSWPWHGNVGSLLPESEVDSDQVLGVRKMGKANVDADPFRNRWANAAKVRRHDHPTTAAAIGSSKFLVNPTPIVVPYHDGPVLVGTNGTLNIYTIYYGTFTAAQKATLQAFLQSFVNSRAPSKGPTVTGWWSITKGFQDADHASVAQKVVPAKSFAYPTYTLGKSLQESDIEKLVLSSLSGLPIDPSGIYLVLTADDVSVVGFCSQLCGTHLHTYPSKATGNKLLPYAWVGNPGKQCPGFCAWPYAKPTAGTGPQNPPLTPPNGDVGIDGMIISVANVIVGVATNPYANAYFQGDATDPVEAAGVCGGMYGTGSYPGFPGNLLVDSKTKASFNVYGAGGREFLVPWIYNPAKQQCAGQFS